MQLIGKTFGSRESLEKIKACFGLDAARRNPDQLVASHSARFVCVSQRRVNEMDQPIGELERFH